MNEKKKVRKRAKCSLCSFTAQYPGQLRGHHMRKHAGRLPTKAKDQQVRGELRFCTGCGAKRRDGWRFCGYCGEKRGTA